VAALAAEFGVRPEGAGKTLWFTRALALSERELGGAAC
jgi:hypothetical protein